MSDDEKMTIDERRKYIRKMKKRYVKSGRRAKGALLDEMETVTGLHRKTLIRLVNGSLERKIRRGGRAVRYGPDVDDALRIIDESFDGICAQRLTPNLVWMASLLANHDELVITSGLIKQLKLISRSTVQRRLNRIRQFQPHLVRRKPQPRNTLLHLVPMRRFSWDITQPGYFETDLVYHCGTSASGEFVYTLQMIDVATGWSERRAILGRSFLVVQDAFSVILRRLPFPVVEVHPDNDSVFLNHHSLRFWGHIVQGVRLSRSRPYHKNDNPHVEQKNASLVRRFLGDVRLDTVAHTLAVNALYDKMGLYYNLFQPVMHLVGKQIIPRDGQPARVKRLYDDALTPFDRLCQTDAILPLHRDQLTALRNAINPRRLRQEIYDAIDLIFSLPGASAGVPEDVHLTLAKNQKRADDDTFTLAFNRTLIRHEPHQCLPMALHTTTVPSPPSSTTYTTTKGSLPHNHP